MRRFPPLLLVACLVLLILPSTAHAVPSFDQAVDRLIGKGYPQAIERALNRYGTTPMGFRFGGSTSDDAAAAYIAKELRACGVQVRLEPVPIDEWEFLGASVEVGGQTIAATTFGGVPPTPRQGLTGDVAYVGSGTAAEFDAVGDVSGKIVLADFVWWVNWAGAEAAARGAEAVIMTVNPETGFYYLAKDALGSFDGCYDMSFAPMVYITWNKAEELKAQLGGATPVKATVKCDTKVRLADDGGVGYNVIGYLRGNKNGGEYVAVNAHHDAYFRAGVDDTSGVVAGLLLAKAMRISNYHPQRTVVFVFPTGEEYGTANCYYDWLVGSLHAVKDHPAWAGKMTGQLNLEAPGMRDGKLMIAMPPELKGWVDQTLAANPGLVGPNGYSLISPVFSGSDQWTFTADGIPGMYYGTAAFGLPYWTQVYHTQFDDESLVDYEFMGMNVKLLLRMEKALDRGLLPYDLRARADDLAGTVDAGALIALGADGATASRLAADVAAFQAAAAAYEAGKAGIPAADVGAVNRALLKVESTILREFTALSAWDATVYPHQQLVADVGALEQAIAALAPSPDKDAALAALQGVGMTYYGPYFDDEVYAKELTRHQPDYYRLGFAELGKLPVALNVMPQYRLIEAGDFATPLGRLAQMRDDSLAELNARMAHMADVLEAVTPIVAGLL